MSEKILEQNPVSSTEKLKNKIKTGLAVGAVGVMALAGEACSPKKGAGTENHSGKTEPRLKSSVYVSPDADFSEAEIKGALKAGLRDADKSHNSLRKGKEMTKGLSQQEILRLYYELIKEGKVSDPDKIVEMTKARAVELAQKKGVKVIQASSIEIKSVGGVPVEVRVDGQPVPVGPGDYTADELRTVRGRQSAPDAIK